MDSNMKRDWLSLRQFVGLMLLSATVLTVEVLLTRIVSVLYYPVGVYFVISLALLGSAAGGVFVALAAHRMQHMVQTAASACLLLAVGTLVALMAVAHAGAQPLTLVVLALALALPFLGGGLAVSLLFSANPGRANWLYFADLGGAGLGAVLASMILLWTSAQEAMILAAGWAGLAAMLLGVDWQRWLQCSVIAVIVAVGVASPWLATQLPIPSLPPKELGMLAAARGDMVREYQAWNPVARVDVVSVPGERIALPTELDYKLVTQDGGAPTMILNSAALEPQTDLTEHTILGIPYWIKPRPEVLIIGLGGGPDVVTALRYDARRVVGVEINSRMIEIVSRTFASYAGRPYADPRVQVILGDGRHVIEASTDHFDIVQLTGVDTAVASVSASPNLAENYLYTVEAFKAYLRHLKPGGLLSISFPNVEGLDVRLFATSLQAMGEMGIQKPLDSIVLSETGGFVHLLVKWQAPFTADDLKVLSRHFDSDMIGIYFPLYYRLMGAGTPDFFASHRLLLTPQTSGQNRYTDYYDAWRRGNGAAWLARQRVEARPTTDDWPYFFIRDRWFTYMPTLSLLLFTLAMLALFALLCLIVPLLVFRRQGARTTGAVRLMAYFTGLGLAYMFIEVFFIQKLSLLLGHPAYAIAVTLGGVLVASGVGSALSTRVTWQPVTRITVAVVVLVILLCAHAWSLDLVVRWALAWPLLLRVLLALLTVGMAGVLMGVPFPTGLILLQGEAEGWVAWAWGMNGVGSVMASLVNLMITVTFGLRVALLSAAVIYCLALLMLRSWAGTRALAQAR
jgi:SAM-dependent methyltransferase